MKPQNVGGYTVAELTRRDLEILDGVTLRIRVLTLHQIARTWWATSTRPIENARDRLKILQGENLVQIERAPAHPELALYAPVIHWNPGGPPPDLGAASYQLQNRWKEHPIPTVCVSATGKAAKRFGGHGGRFPRPVERTHDIHLARVYLLYRRLGATSGWTFEEELRANQRRRSERLPDVIIQNGRFQKVVEFGGSYPKAKLEAFHDYCAKQNLPYEVW